MSLNRSAVLVPGIRGGPNAVWHKFAGIAAERRGATVHRIDWEADADSLQDEEAAHAWVRARVAPVLDDAGPRPLLIGKSLGSFAASLAAQRQLPAIWFTPLMTFAPVVNALREATAPFLLVGGDADVLWDGALAHELTPHVLQLSGADHGFVVAGRPLRDTAALLGQLADAVEDFCDNVVW